MKILKLEAENVKKLRAVEITPTGEIVTIAGANGAGKTSILDAIWWALAGTAAIQMQPIRKGETKARIRLDLGELVVERRFTDKGSSLVVENAQGARFPSPQKMLDSLLGALAFDPLAFARMKPRDQYDELRKIAQLDINPEQLDGLNRSDFAKRTEVNRDAKAKRAQAEAIVLPPAMPAGRIDEAKILDRIQQAGEQNIQIEQAKARRARVADTIAQKRAEAVARARRAAQLREEAAALDAQQVEILAEATALEQQLQESPSLPEPVDVTGIRAELEQAQQTNKAFAQRERRDAVVQEAVALERRAQDLTESIEAREKAKADAIARASMPVPGLGFGDGLVTLNGVPFEQASSAEQLRVSLSIAIAANPKLRVIRIQDGSLLDANSMAAIAEMAKAHDMQVWIEVVSTDGKMGFVIDDGSVIAVDGEPVPVKAAA